MTDLSSSLQDSFLEQLVATKVPTTLFLINGVKLQGIIAGFDDTVVALRRDAHTQLVYKHAISTVLPSEPLALLGETPPVPSA